MFSYRADKSFDTKSFISTVFITRKAKLKQFFLLLKELWGLIYLAIYTNQVLTN